MALRGNLVGLGGYVWVWVVIVALMLIWASYGWPVGPFIGPGRPYGGIKGPIGRVGRPFGETGMLKVMLGGYWWTCMAKR